MVVVGEKILLGILSTSILPPCQILCFVLSSQRWKGHILKSHGIFHYLVLLIGLFGKLSPTDLPPAGNSILFRRSSLFILNPRKFNGPVHHSQQTQKQQ